MSNYSVTCPSCRSALRSSRPVPTNQHLRCPQCGNQFVYEAGGSPPDRSAGAGWWAAGEDAATTPPPPLTRQPVPVAPYPAVPPASNNTFMKSFVIALVSSLLLLGTGVAVTLLVLRRDNPTPPAEQAKTEPESTPDPEQERLRQEREKLEKEKQELEQQKNALEANRLVTSASDAFNKGDYVLAEKLYMDARKLAPGDESALNGLVATRAALLLDEKATQENTEKQATYDRAIKQAQEALEARQYAVAASAFDSALRVKPGDEEAAKGLAEAKKNLEADAEQQKMLTQYQGHMEAGRVAMINQRYADAIREYTAALRLIPGDAEATKGIQQAEQRIAAIEDLEKRKAARAELLREGRAAAANRRFLDAITAFNSILKLFPGDVETERELDAVKKEQARAKAEAGRLMKQAELALAARRFEEAHRLFTEAARLNPDDLDAVQGAEKAAKLFQDFQAAQAAYFRFMNQGTFALQAGRYADAAFAFREALRLVPGDLQAAQGLQEAQKGLEEEIRLKRDFDRLMQSGTNAAQQQRYTEAVNYYLQAQKLFPADQRLLRLISQAKYANAMNEGQAALRSKRYADAVTFFEQALLEAPGDFAATSLLRQAQALNR